MSARCGTATRVDGDRSELLRCPHCAQPLRREERTWRCPSGHAFDVARQGYVNLLAGRSAHRGDTPEMLDARAAVHAAGVLDALTVALVEACADAADGALVEVGAGTGHHLAAVSAALGGREAVALDSSPAAARRAARTGALSVVADAWAPWPLLDAVAARVLVVFAPRNGPEAARVLRPDGLLVVAVPRPGHLAALRTPLGLLDVPPDKAGAVAEGLAPSFALLDRREVSGEVEVDRALAARLALMGPAGHHVGLPELERRAAALPERTAVEVAVDVLRLAPAAPRPQAAPRPAPAR